jgi:hypothetical protein
MAVGAARLEQASAVRDLFSGRSLGGDEARDKDKR